MSKPVWIAQSFDGKHATAVRRLKRNWSAASNREVMRRAVLLADKLVHAKANGSEIVIRTGKTEKVVEL